jgi:hypothetical protein
MTDTHLVAEIWRISIADSTTDAVRGRFHPILEAYFPHLDASMNLAGKLNIVLKPTDRYNTRNPPFNAGASKPKYLGVVSFTPSDSALIHKIVDAERDSARDKMCARLRDVFDNIEIVERNHTLTMQYYIIVVAVLSFLVTAFHLFNRAHRSPLGPLP